MRVRRVIVEQFRGIQACTWNIPSRLVCIVGSGGSTKTTLLDAMGLALSTSYRPQFTDADFWQGDTSKPIRIEVAVTDLPVSLVHENAFGLERCGLRESGEIEHDPVPGTEPCLLVTLKVCEDLEPSWAVARPGEPDGKPISAAQRAKLGFFRLGDNVDAHLRWGRASALSAMTEGRTEASAIVLEAHRQARKTSFASPLSELQSAADTVTRKSRELGAARYDRLQPALDSVAANTSALVLHDGAIPLTSEGLGTRRLTALAIQREAVEGGSIIAIDEVEHGLEPHRLHHLLERLKTAAVAGELQVLLSTHSPVAVAALCAADLAVTRSDGGITTVRSVDADLDTVQGTVRSAPSALLARRIVVAEGATEVGFIRELCLYWNARRREQDGTTAVTAGVAIVNGGGASAPKRARIFQSLGYPCAAVFDNDDRSVDRPIAAASAAGVKIIRWAEGHALEDEIVAVLPDAGLREFIALAIERRGEDSVRATVANHLGVDDLVGVDPLTWVDQEHQRDALCRALANAATGRRPTEGDPQSGEKVQGTAWFKREDGGEQLARLICGYASAVAGTHLAQQLTALRKFIYVNS